MYQSAEVKEISYDIYNTPTKLMKSIALQNQLNLKDAYWIQRNARD